MTTKFPSIPVPTADVPSMYQAVSAMRQTIQLLIVNQQQPSDATLSKASQIFATTGHVAQAIQSAQTQGPQGAQGLPGPPGPKGDAGPAGPAGSGGGLADAPSNSLYYGRINASWGTVLGASSPRFSSVPVDAANDAAAATAGIPVGGVYKNGSILMVRVA